MYNKSIEYIINKIQKKEKIPNIKELKSILKKEKEKIIENYILKINNKSIKIPAHTLDYAINDALINYKGRTTSLKSGDIKHFRLRKRKMRVDRKMCKLEKSAVTENSIFAKILGNHLKTSKGSDYNFKKNYECVNMIIKRGSEYYYLEKNIPETEKTKTENISVNDFGYKTYSTSYTNNGIEEIGKGIGEKIKIEIIKANKIMKEESKKILKENIIKKREKNKLYKMSENEINELVKKKAQKIKNKKTNKIKNKVNDFQWKVAKYMTDKFSCIIVGNLSTKKTGETKMNKMQKDVGKMLSFYKFKEKLKNRCLHKNVEYKEVYEGYTSKACTKCANIKHDLGNANVYECEKCKIKIGRDVGASRTIVIASLHQ
jgi:hypothetical protein